MFYIHVAFSHVAMYLHSYVAIHPSNHIAMQPYLQAYQLGRYQTFSNHVINTQSNIVIKPMIYLASYVIIQPYIQIELFLCCHSAKQPFHPITHLSSCLHPHLANKTYGYMPIFQSCKLLRQLAVQLRNHLVTCLADHRATQPFGHIGIQTIQ